jgi:hypothetical protein
MTWRTKSLTNKKVAMSGRRPSTGTRGQSYRTAYMGKYRPDDDVPDRISRRQFFQELANYRVQADQRLRRVLRRYQRIVIG